jgi:hypothetical protein
VDGETKHAVKYRCWADSRFASLGFTRMLRRHRRLRTWHEKVDLFVALNSFMRDLLVKHFQSINMPITLKYIDPSYMVRACPANAHDAIYCIQLAQNEQFLLQCVAWLLSAH